MDSYSGPPDLRARIEAEPQPSFGGIADDAGALLADLEADEPDVSRGRWLSAQLTGLETACRWFAGEQIPYAELVRRCHQVEAKLVPENEFAAAHARIEEVLPGKGSVHERFVAWRKSQYVPPERVELGLETLAAELRERTDALVGLPDGDQVGFVLETGKPWLGFCEYLGDLRTRISINIDLPIPSYKLFELVTHEVYPGHHTEHLCKEPLIREGRLELAVYLFPTPHSLVAEGIAKLAHEVLFGEQADHAGADILGRLGIAYDADTAAVVRSAQETLGSVGPNVVQLLAEGRLADDEVRPYARRWLIGPDELVDRAVALLDGHWRPYALCYPAGRELARRFVGGDPARFRRLLSEQLTPQDLAA